MITKVGNLKIVAVSGIRNEQGETNLSKKMRFHKISD